MVRFILGVLPVGQELNTQIQLLKFMIQVELKESILRMTGHSGLLVPLEQIQLFGGGLLLQFGEA